MSAAFATLCPVKRTHAAAAVMLLAAVPALAGCFNGPDATTTTQATMNSGNGVEAQQGAISIEGTTLVMGPEDSGTATLVVRLVNAGPEDDVLTYATINGVPATIVQPTSTQDGLLLPGASVSYGFESDGRIDAAEFDAPVSSYVPVELGFQKAGLSKLSVLTVPPVGYYEGITPGL